MEEELRRIGIDLPGEMGKDGTYIINIPDSNQYGKIYSKLENWPELDEDEDASITTHAMSSIQYDGVLHQQNESLSEDDDTQKKPGSATTNFTITLLANLDDDEYKLVMKEY